MKHKYLLLKICCLLIAALLLAGCEEMPFLQEEVSELHASGIVEVEQVDIASTAGGRVKEVYVNEGDTVDTGQVLFQLEDPLLKAQHEQALASQESARANLEAAQASLSLAQASLLAAESARDLAEIQYEQVLNTSRLAEQLDRSRLWDEEKSDEFQTPPWYFSQQAELFAAEENIEAAKASLEADQAAYDELLQDPIYSDLQEAEARLARAQVEYINAQALLNREISQTGREQLLDVLEENFDNAETELNAAQDTLDQVIEQGTTAEILEAKAKVTVSQEMYQEALNYWASQLTGEYSLDVQAASINMDQAEANVTTAEAAKLQAEATVSAAETAIDQTQTGINLIELQIEEMQVDSPASGVILVKAIQPGEIIGPGMVAMTVGALDELTITVFVPEERYGQIRLGNKAEVTSESFPDEIFPAVVTRISDQAEYTPSNVQTEEDRNTVVFAIQLSVDDPSGKLKPGMPVDVLFY